MTGTTNRGRFAHRIAIAAAGALIAAVVVGCGTSSTAATQPATPPSPAPQTLSTAASDSGIKPLPATDSTAPSSPAAGSTASASASGSGMPQHAVAGLVTVGASSVNVLCTGSASSKPTIVLVAGLPDPLTKFAALQATLSRTTRVCSYDRPGEGASPTPAASQTLASAATLLDGVLDAEKITGKVIVVAHSLGGLIAAQFAHQYPARVAALVLLDASAPSIGSAIQALIPATPTGVYAEVRAETDSLSSPSKNPEKLVYSGTPIGSLGSIPLTVVQHGLQIYAPVPKYGQQLQTIWTKGQAQLAQLSTNSKLITAAKSGHYIYLDQPALTVQLIQHATTA